MALFSRRRGASRGPKNNVWTVILFDELTVDDTPAVEGVIVAVTDWSGATGNEKATLLRIRGYLTVALLGAASTNKPVFMAIYISDKDTGVLSPTGVAAYTDEDILWTGGVSLPAVISGEGHTQHIEIDVKSMRRINSSQEVRITMQGAAAGTVSVSGVLRGLVRKGGN